MIPGVPYKFRGNSVVKSDSGEVVKSHPSREKALAHLRALKANVEESAGGVLGALLEGAYDEARHPRGFHGRWVGSELHVFHGASKITTVSASGSTSRERLLSAVQGAVRARPGRPAIDRVEAQRVVDLAAGTPPKRSEAYRGLGETPMGVASSARERGLAQLDSERNAKVPRPRVRGDGRSGPIAPSSPAQQSSGADRHGGFKIGDVVTHETGSRGAGGHGPVTFTKQPGMSTVVGLQRNGNLRIKHPATGTTHDVHHSHAQKVSPLHPDYRGKVVQDAYAAQKAELARQKAERAGKAFDPVTTLGLEGTAARERGASSPTTEHADTRDKLTNLPVGQRYGLHGPQGQVGHVQRTAAGWEVVGPSKPATVHKTPSSAAGEAMRIQRTAASSREQANVMMRNYRAGREVERMNARQSQIAAAHRNRRLAARARLTGKMSESDVLGALLEGC